MARKDKIFQSFLSHELLSEKYELTKEDFPDTIQAGLKSEHKIIRTLALIVDHSESANPFSDKALYSIVTKFLNNTVL